MERAVWEGLAPCFVTMLQLHLGCKALTHGHTRHGDAKDYSGYSPKMGVVMFMSSQLKSCVSLYGRRASKIWIRRWNAAAALATQSCSKLLGAAVARASASA